MTVILVLALFVTCLVVERFTNKKAPEYVLQTAPYAEAGARKATPIVSSSSRSPTSTFPTSPSTPTRSEPNGPVL